MKGYCNTTRMSSFAAIWHSILNTDDLIDLCTLLNKAFEKTRKELGLNKDAVTKYYFSDEFLKFLKVVKLAPI